MKNIIIKNKASKKFLKQFPLVQEADLITTQELPTKQFSKEWVAFYSEKKEFLGYGYLGKQNKGIGWLLSFKEEQPLDTHFFETLFRQSFKKRERFFDADDTNAFRLLNGEGDGLGGLTIDWYDGYLVLSWYNDTIYSYQAELIGCIKEVLPSIKGIYEKIRFANASNTQSQFVSGASAPEPLVVLENGVRYATYLNEGLMTGIFLDQKDVRGTLTEGIASGKTVLNTFSYTGAFSVAALIGGAAHTTSVDLAKRSVEKTREQFEVNGIDAGTQDILVMDVFNYFNYAQKKGKTFDIVVLDPPSFARNKKKTFSVAKDYGTLTIEAAHLVTENGYLVASTNAANVTFEKFDKMVQSGIKETGKSFKKMNVYRLPEDFSVSSDFVEGNYLKVIIYQLY